MNCSAPWAEALAELLPTAIRGINVAEVNAVGADALGSLLCVAGRARVHIRSYTAVQFGASGHRGPAPVYTPANLRARLEDRAASARTASSGAAPVAVRVLRTSAPTVRPLVARSELAEGGFDLLVLRMDGDSPAARQSLRIDLTHALRLVSARGLVVARSERRCRDDPADRKDPRTEIYAGRFGSKNAVQCWAGRWDELVGFGTVSALPLGGAAERASGELRAGRVLARSACATSAARPPVLLAATRRPVILADPPPPPGTPPPKKLPAGRKGPLGWGDTEQLRKAHLRYLSVLSCEGGGGGGDGGDGDDVCMLFKDETQETWVGSIASADGLAFVGPPRLVYPKHAKKWAKGEQGVMTHNLAIARDVEGGGYVMMGGTHKNRANSGRPWQVNGFHQGIWIARGASHLYDPASNLSIYSVDAAGSRVPAATQWRGKRLALRGTASGKDGTVGGCIERRDRVRMPWIIQDTCEFDGRLSILFFRGELLLYARANMGSHGQRFVQMTRSRDGGRSWSRFSPIEIAGYNHTQGDLYFFGVQLNPADDSTLLATFPLVHHLHGCIGMALSRDGVRWSRVTPLMACEAVGERTLAHPAAPAMIRRGGTVWVYVHESVPGASVDAYMPYALYEAWRAIEAEGRVARYDLPMSALERWSRRARRSLAQGGGEVEAEPAPPGAGAG